MPGHDVDPISALLTVNGDATGLATVGSVTGFYVGATIALQAWQVKLKFKTQTGAFTVGQVVTGAGGAFGTIASQVDDGGTGYLLLTTVTGVFVDNEDITDPITGAAKSDGTNIQTVTQTGQGKILDIDTTAKTLAIRLNDTRTDLFKPARYDHSDLSAYLVAEHATIYQEPQFNYGAI